MVFYTVYLLDGENLFVSTRTMSIKSLVQQQQQEKIESCDTSDHVQEQLDTKEKEDKKEDQEDKEKEKEDEDQGPGNGDEEKLIKMM